MNQRKFLNFTSTFQFHSLAFNNRCQGLYSKFSLNNQNTNNKPIVTLVWTKFSFLLIFYVRVLENVFFFFLWKGSPWVPVTHKHLPLYTVYEIKSIHSPQINKVSSETILSTFLETRNLSSSKSSIWSVFLPNFSCSLPALRETWLFLKILSPHWPLKWSFALPRSSCLWI